MPEDQRAIALSDGSITSTFLEMFGRPARDTGLESERNNRITATQRLQLLNSTQIQRKLEQGPKLQALFGTRGGPRQVATELYYTILARPPTAAELQSITSSAQSGRGNTRTNALDLAWALMNSAEFLYRH